MSKFEDLTNQRFGRLLVLKRANNYVSKNNVTSAQWLCQCNCGKQIIVRTSYLKSKHTTSCGCFAREQTIARNRKTNKYEQKSNYILGYTFNGATFVFDNEDYDKVKEHCWYKLNNGYIITRIDNKTVTLHRFILNFPDSIIDHINRDKSDNRKSNLRLVTKRQNNCNRGVSKNNKCGCLGVFFDKGQNKWTAALNYKGKKYFKRFTTFDEAKIYRKELEEKYFKF